MNLRSKSFCKAPASLAKQQDLQHFIGEATGIMPVWKNEVKDVDDYPSSVAGKPRERMALCALSASFRL